MQEKETGRAPIVTQATYLHATANRAPMVSPHASPYQLWCGHCHCQHGTMLKTLETTNHKIHMMMHELVEVNELILG